jgi:CheY-like chemotaxis protein
MKILVVEESPLTRKFIINELKTEGFEIEVAASAEEALGVLETVPDIGLITLRVVMEGMDGFQFVDHLQTPEVRRRLRPLRNDRIPTIFVTSNDTDEDRLRGYKVGAAYFIQKPWPKGDLVKHVNMALGRGSQFSGETVLVVDDSPTARRFIAACLAHLGVNILEADDGDTAVEILADPTKRVDLVVTDLMMERMDGDELCVKIRGELGLTDLPIIFLSGNEDKTTILSLFKMGATDYLKKPFMKEELVARLRAYLDRESSRKALLESLAKLQETNLLKDEFMTVCSQDLYSPMESILGYLEGAAPAEADSERRDGVCQSGHHLLSILSNLMDLGKMASGREKLSFEAQNWQEILETALTGHRHTARSKGIRLDFRVATSDTGIRGDRSSLMRICNNVISNAIKFTPRGGRVAVTLGPGRSGELALEVADNGLGIAAEQLPDIFDRYHRTTTEGTDGEKGTGLGLAITRELVERHGGTIAVDSKPQVGTAIKVLLPLASSAKVGAASMHSPGEPRPVPGGLDGCRVLLVKSGSDRLAQEETLLARLGCRVTAAAAGSDAVTVFSRQGADRPFDVVLLDLGTDVQAACESAAALRQAESGHARDLTPILALVSRGLDGQLPGFLAAGVNDFLTRPLAEPAVKEALERWLSVPV